MRLVTKKLSDLCLRYNPTKLCAEGCHCATCSMFTDLVILAQEVLEENQDERKH